LTYKNIVAKKRPSKIMEMAMKLRRKLSGIFNRVSSGDFFVKAFCISGGIAAGAAVSAIILTAAALTGPAGLAVIGGCAAVGAAGGYKAGKSLDVGI
jgi:predicted ATP-dependent Lon-type protease